MPGKGEGQQKGATPASGGAKGGGAAANNKLGSGGNGSAPLSARFPVNSTWEFTLPNDDVVQGTVYCTDEISQTIVLQKSLVHTTLAFEVRMVQAASIKNEKLVTSSAENSTNSNDSSLSTPLPVVQKKVLEEREKRALRLAEEGFRHINQNASREGQAVFDRLVKACNEVVWKGESITVLNQIQVDPPYGQDNCKIIARGPGADNSLERVKKIVAAAGGGVSSGN